MQEVLENKANHKAMLKHKVKQRTSLVSKLNSNVE